MGFRIFGSFLILTLLCTKSLFGQRPNTDESFILEFLREMGLKHPQDNGFSGSFCSWRGLLCDDSREHAIELELSDLGLSGPIPDSTIGKLTKLTKLDLSVNKITALPSDLWDLGSLHTLNLSHNQITGSLSSNIVNFGHLQSLDLSFNDFSGSIPEGISSLPDLQALNLSRNGFESSIPLGISQCKSLVAIDLSENSLTGPLPNGFGTALPQLRLLSLAGNGISGRDSDFSGMRLNHLNLSGNVFRGSLVGLFGGPLEVIDLSRNQFEGHLPQANFSSDFDWSTLVYLDLSENYLSGEFFTGFDRARNLRHLNLAFNRFTQQQFIRVDTLANLEYLNLSSTNLIGLIPSNVSYLAHLRTLDLSRNQLSSRISLAFTSNLEILDLSYNNLTGEIPLALIHELHGMEMFNFSYNNLSFCGTQFPQKVLQSAFIRSINSCPIAANPDFFRRKSPKHEGLKIALVLTISIVFLLVGLLFLAFRFQWKTRMGAVKQNSSYREEQSVSGPFSFQTDLTTWVADVKQATSVPVIIFEKPLLNFTFSDLLSATSNFDRATLLAEGRFGPVYSGLLPGGIHVAVKVLVNGSTMSDEEAAKELEYLGRIKHPNLVPLTGYCLAGDQRIAIYEYMENGNLQNFLHDLPFGVGATEDWSTDTWEEENSNGIQNVGLEGSPAATWQFRHKIALGSARALAFLHHGCSPSIIHRDVRTSSVYLDFNLEPRLSDFGLAKIFGNGLDEMARGPPGYLPPEFVENEERSPVWDPTPKSDVYGFGVVLLELVTGKRPVEDIYPEDKEGNLVRWVRGLVRMNLGLRAIDPKIRGTGPDEQIVEALKIGYLCTAELPWKRPSMQQVVGLLKDLEQIKAY